MCRCVSVWVCMFVLCAVVEDVWVCVDVCVVYVGSVCVCVRGSTYDSVCVCGIEC